jgi:hypothetical protein
MFGPQLDERTADRLLAGAVGSQEAPAGFAEVASLLRNAAAAPTAGELARQAEAVDAAVRLAGVDQEFRSLLEPRGHARMRVHPSRLKIAGVAVGALLLSTGGLAFAGSLPGPAQDAVSHALDPVGISIPASDHPESDHPASTGKEISGIATTTDATGVAKGAEISDAASGGVSQAGDHGAAATGAPTSGGGSTGLADDDSGGAAQAGSGTANEDSGGHSSAGASNASGAPGS